MTNRATDHRTGNHMMPGYVPCYGADSGAFETPCCLRLTDSDTQRSYRDTKRLLNIYFSLTIVIAGTPAPALLYSVLYRSRKRDELIVGVRPVMPSRSAASCNVVAPNAPQRFRDVLERQPTGNQIERIAVTPEWAAVVIRHLWRRKPRNAVATNSGRSNSLSSVLLIAVFPLFTGRSRRMQYTGYRLHSLGTLFAPEIREPLVNTVLETEKAAHVSGRVYRRESQRVVWQRQLTLRIDSVFPCFPVGHNAQCTQCVSE